MVYLKDALLAAMLGLLLLGPLMSFVLDGYHVHFKFLRSIWLVGIIFVGRLLFLLLCEKKKFSTKFLIKPAAMLALSPRFTFYSLISFFLFGLILPFLLNPYWQSMIIFAYIYIMLGLGLNIVVGLAGLLNLGFVAFYAVGAYTFALGSHYFHLGLWTALPVGALFGALSGALLAFPVLKMYGDYLAIVTLGFGEILYLILNNWSDVTGGPNGMSVPRSSYLLIYFVLYAALCLTIGFVKRLQQMPLGRNWEALREDEIACRSLGINHVTTKVSAFSLGAMLAGIAGVFFAGTEGFINPASFTFTESALILSIVVLGGMGSILGIVLAALLLTLLPEILREFSEYRMLIFGASLIMMMIWRPQGLIQYSRKTFSRPTHD